MWPNSESCSILFWHLAQWQCTTNPEMNFPANPDYHTAHPPQRHPIGLHWKEMKKENLVVELPIPHHTMSKLKSINQMKTIIVQYTQHARNKIMPSETILGCQISSYLFLPRGVPSSGLWKVIIIFRFPLILTVHKKPPDSFLVLISYSEGQTKEFSETHTLLSRRGNWADNATVAWQGLC